MQHLYMVKVARVVLAKNLDEARKLALSVDNPEDFESVEPIQNLFDIPTGWENAIPYGAEAQTTRQCLVAQLAADARFDGFEVHPCLTAGEDEHGQIILEQCDQDDRRVDKSA